MVRIVYTFDVGGDTIPKWVRVDLTRILGDGLKSVLADGEVVDILPGAMVKATVMRRSKSPKKVGKR